MADFVKVPVESGNEDAPGGDEAAVVLFEASESDLVSRRTGRADVKDLAGTAAGRLEAIAEAAEQVQRSLAQRLSPDEIELEISVGLSGEVGWFVAKSSASGGLKLTLTWKGGEAVP